MDALKTKWNGLDRPVRITAVVGAVIVGLIAVVKVLPALVAAMGVGLFLAILFVPFWLPTIVAFYRKHPSRGGILALNLLLGWTFVGWVVALAWALSDNSARAGAQSVTVNTTVTTPAPYRVGDIVNGMRFDGAAWAPAPAPSVASAPLAAPDNGIRPQHAEAVGANGSSGL